MTRAKWPATEPGGVRECANASWRWGALALLLTVAAGCGREDTTVVSAPAERGAERQQGALGAPVAPAAAGSSSSAGRPPAGGAAGLPAPARARPPVVTAEITRTRSGGFSDSFRHRLPGRLIAIGDVHGDLAATRAALRLGGAIDAEDRWIGQRLTVVQTGDQLDRGDDEREIVDLFQRLKLAAAASGGQVIALNGNHEIMNVQGDFRYVTPGAIGDFAGVAPRSPLAIGAPAPFGDRAAAFLPGGSYALVLAERDVIAVVGDTVFVHGGVLPEHVRYGIDRINSETRQWMRAGARAAPEAVAREDAPVWVRQYSLDPVAPRACELLSQVLSALGAARMVVGHTVQRTGITSACGDRVYRIDVGLSRYYGGSLIQVLEIEGAEVRILAAPRAGEPIRR